MPSKYIFKSLTSTMILSTLALLRACSSDDNNAQTVELPDNPLEDSLLNSTSIPQLWNFLDLTEQDQWYRQWLNRELIDLELQRFINMFNREIPTT